MYKNPRGRFQGPYCGEWTSRCIKELVRPARAAPPKLLYLKLSSGNFSILAACRDFTVSLEAKGRRGRKQRGPLLNV
jgi:hypothetical protein